MLQENKITHPKKLAFLQNYPKFKSITDTAKAVGIGRQTVYLWLEADKVFKDKLYSLKKEIDDELLERVEVEIEGRALGTKPSKMGDVLLMFLAKGLAPDKYRERPVIDKAIIGDVIVKLATPPYLDEGGRDAIQITRSTEGSQSEVNGEEARD